MVLKYIFNSLIEQNLLIPILKIHNATLKIIP